MAADDEFPDVEAETSFDIQLYIYDMTKGLAKSLSVMLLGKSLLDCSCLLTNTYKS